MITSLVALWQRLPALLRAPLIAFVVLNIGTAATAVPLFANLKFHPEVPWAFPVTLIVTAVFWYYFTGGGFPKATQQGRADVTRRKSLPWPIWRAAMLPMVLSIVAVASLRLILPGIFSMDAPKLPFNLSIYPFATVVGLLAALVVSAGVVEEIAFRGYLQKPLEDAYGIFPALLLTGLAFWFAHSDKVSLAHLPFHLFASIVLGLTAYLTRSLLPAIVGHAIGDALLQPAYVFQKPAFVWSALNARPVWEGSSASTIGERAQLIWHAMDPAHVFETGSASVFAILAWTFLLSTLLTIPAMIRLANVSRRAFA